MEAAERNSRSLRSLQTYKLHCRNPLELKRSTPNLRNESLFEPKPSEGPLTGRPSYAYLLTLIAGVCRPSMLSV